MGAVPIFIKEITMTQKSREELERQQEQERIQRQREREQQEDDELEMLQAAHAVSHAAGAFRDAHTGA